MWKKLKLETFKCHETLSLALAPLTLLTGFNAAGKSTVMQSLILLNQTIRENQSGKRIILNGDSVKLGSVRDVINTTKSRNSFTIGIETNECECSWTTLNEDRNELTAAIQTIEVNSRGGTRFRWSAGAAASESGITVIPSDIPLQALIPRSFRHEHFPLPALEALSTRLGGLTYICAERIGPRETYEMFPEDGERTVGVTGERTAWFLDEFGDKEVLLGMRLPNSAPTLQHQVGQWLREFFPGAGFQVLRVPDANLVTLRMRSNESSDFYRPQNVGYGLTHVLPIITACVGAAPGDLLLIENPEAHLHPAGQSRIGRMLVTAAAAGMQVMVETHSDHVLNGIRVAIKEGVMSCEDLQIYSFDRDAADLSHEVRVTSPKVDRHGKIAEWPSGFFDESEKLLLELL